jgi:hypothetical protein
MKEQFVSYEIAKKLKELGFDEPCLGYYSDWGTQEPFLISCEYGQEKESCAIRRKNYLCSAPLLQQALDWFRDKHKIHIEVERDFDGWCYKITEFSSGNKFKCGGSAEMSDHNVEVNKAIIKAFELIKV